MGENASKYDFTVEELQILNQIKCHILLNGNKLGLKTPLQENLPSEIEIEPYMPFENDNFSKQLQSFLKENKFSEPKTIDFYQSIGCKNLNGGKLDRTIIFLNGQNEAFVDTGSHSSYIRLRRDHLNKLGHTNILQNEIDQNEYEIWRQKIMRSQKRN